MSENSDHSEKEYAQQLLKTGRLLEVAIRQAIQALQLEQGSVGLDAGCGIGTHTITKTAPYLKDARPDRHFLRALGWMQSVGLQGIGVRSFAADAYAPLAPEIREAIDTCSQMFFGNLESHVSQEDWAMFQKLCTPESDDYLLKRPDYYCLLNYSMFYGRVAG